MRPLFRLLITFIAIEKYTPIVLGSLVQCSHRKSSRQTADKVATDTQANSFTSLSLSLFKGAHVGDITDVSSLGIKSYNPCLRFRFIPVTVTPTM